MSTSDEDGPCFIYRGTADTRCHLDMLADYCHTLPVRPKEEVCEQFARQLSQGCSFTFVHRKSYAFNPLLEWLHQGPDEAEIFQYFFPSDSRNLYQQCKVGQATRHGTAYVVHVFYRDVTVSCDYSTLANIMIELEVPFITRETLLLRSKMHAVLSAIYHEHGPLNAESCLSGFMKDAEALADVLQKEFGPGNERILGQLGRAFRFKAEVELLKALCSKSTSVESRSFFRNAVFKTMDENLAEMDKSYRK